VDMLPLLEKEAVERKAEGGMRTLEARGVIEQTDTPKENEVENVVSPGRAKMPYLGKASEQAAEMVGTSPRYVSDAKHVKKEAPEAFEGLRAGTVTRMRGATPGARWRHSGPMSYVYLLFQEVRLLSRTRLVVSAPAPPVTT